MTTFANTTNPTPFAAFDSDTDFQSDADKMVTFVKRKLGDDILSVELTKKQTDSLQIRLVKRKEVFYQT